MLPKELKTFKFGGFSSHTNLDCFSTALCSAWCFGPRNITSQACFLGNLFLVTSSWWVLLFCLFGWGFGFIFQGFLFIWDSQCQIFSWLNSWEHILCFSLIFLQADMEVPARSIRVPLQYVEQDESKGIRSFLRCWLTAVKGHCCLAPHKGFLHQEDSPPSLRYGSLSWQVYSRAGKRGAGAAVGKPLNFGKQSPKTCLWV